MSNNSVVHRLTISFKLVEEFQIVSTIQSAPPLSSLFISIGWDKMDRLVRIDWEKGVGRDKISMSFYVLNLEKTYCRAW